jgi:hypothetical protein
MSNWSFNADNNAPHYCRLTLALGFLMKQLHMTFLARLRYSFLLAIVLSAAASMAIMLASADSIELLPPSATDLAFSPGLFALAYIIAFGLATIVAEHLPFKRGNQ